MTTDIRNDLGKVLKQRRLKVPLTLQELATASGVSLSYLGRIESGKRFPSAHTLRKIARPLGFEESELFLRAGFLSSRPPVAEIHGEHNVGQLDPYVAAVLSQESVEIQRAVVAILTVLKSIAKALR
jgi:transcriptional regulator with XRE-family HTH domain